MISVLGRIISTVSSSVLATEGYMPDTKVRYAILGLGCLANIIGYSDRSNLSLAIVPMQRAAGLTDADVGLALGAFFMGYICTQVTGGWLALRYGPKLVLTFAVFFWSVSTLLTPWAASGSLGLLVTARIAIGLGEGLCLPCLHVLAVEWVPATERSTAAAAMTSGQFLGTVIALSAAPLAEWWWPSLFYLFGVLGLVWCVIFWLLATSTPEQHPRVSAEEIAYIRGGRTDGAPGSSAAGSEDSDAMAMRIRSGCESSSTDMEHCSSSSDEGPVETHVTSSVDAKHERPSAATAVAVRRRAGVGAGARPPVPWRRFFTTRACYAIYASHFTHNWGWYLLLSWLPKFLASFGADVSSAGFLTMLAMLTAFGCSNASAAIADRLLLRRLRLSLTRTRKLIEGTAKIVPAAAFLILALTATAVSDDASPPAPPPSVPSASPLQSTTTLAGGGSSGNDALLLALLTALACVALGAGALTHSGCNPMTVSNPLRWPLRPRTARLAHGPHFLPSTHLGRLGQHHGRRTAPRRCAARDQ